MVGWLALEFCVITWDQEPPLASKNRLDEHLYLISLQPFPNSLSSYMLSKVELDVMFNYNGNPKFSSNILN